MELKVLFFYKLKEKLKGDFAPPLKSSSRASKVDLLFYSSTFVAPLELISRDKIINLQFHLSS